MKQETNWKKKKKPPPHSNRPKIFILKKKNLKNPPPNIASQPRRGILAMVVILSSVTNSLGMFHSVNQSRWFSHQFLLGGTSFVLKKKTWNKKTWLLRSGWREGGQSEEKKSWPKCCFWFSSQPYTVSTLKETNYIRTLTHQKKTSSVLAHDWFT